MRIAFICGAALIVVFSWPALESARAQESLASWTFSGELAHGREMAPVNLNMEGRDSRLVFLGSRIVNGAGGCSSCHTCPSLRSNDPLSAGTSGLEPGKATVAVNALNYLAGGVPFGPIKSSNLTPDATGLPGGMKYDQFLSSMQNGGHHQDLTTSVQMTPSPSLRNMLEGELAAVYEYLQALPTAAPGTCSRAGEAASN